STIPPSSSSGRRAVSERGAFVSLLRNLGDRAHDNLSYRVLVHEMVLLNAAAVIEDQRSTLDALRASLDPDNPEAVEAWAAALQRALSMPWLSEHWPEGWLRQADTGTRPLTLIAVALLRAQREAERP